MPGWKKLSLPCGSCVGCRLELSRMWAMRATHEASLWDDNCFITLTYDDDHLPEGGRLRHRDYQLFMKKLRREFAGRSIRYLMSGEYGEGFSRPHYHAILFNHDFADKEKFSRTKTGHFNYVSETLSDLWGQGHAVLGEMSFQSAAYVARYALKNDDAPAGFFEDRPRPYGRMSLNPAIGLDWFRNFKDEVYRGDFAVVRGQKCKPPRYYDKKFDEVRGLDMIAIKEAREERAKVREPHNTRSRLDQREAVALARLEMLRRT